MKRQICEFQKTSENLGSKYKKKLNQGAHPKSLTVVEKRACSSLAELSNSICENHLQETKPGQSISGFNLYSPWNNKSKEIQESGRLKNKRSTLQILEKLKKGTPIYKRKRENSKILGSLYRHTTEPKQQISKVVNGSSLEKYLEERPEQNETQDLIYQTYTSHQVLHITRPLKDCTNEIRKSQKRQKVLIPGHAKIECKPYFKELPSKENLKKNLLNRLEQGNWNHKILNLKCTKKNKLKRLFKDGKSKEKSNLSNKFLSSALVNASLNHISGSNPVSRTLLEKYLLLVNDESNKQNK